MLRMQDEVRGLSNSTHDGIQHLEEPKHNKLIKKAKYSNLIEELREMLLKRKGRTESSTGK